MDFAEVVRSLHELVVVLLHAVAYRCDVYPAYTFSLVRQYGTATQQNNHPGFRRWTESAATTLLSALGDAQRPCSFSIVVLENNKPTQRVGFTLDVLEGNDGSGTDLVNPSDLETQYRAVLVTILNMQLEDVSNETAKQSQQTQADGPDYYTEPDRSMTVVYDGKRPKPNDEAWLPAQPDTTIKTAVKPVRYVEAGCLGINVYYQKLHWQPPLERNPEDRDKPIIGSRIEPELQPNVAHNIEIIPQSRLEQQRGVGVEWDTASANKPGPGRETNSNETRERDVGDLGDDDSDSDGFGTRTQYGRGPQLEDGDSNDGF